MNMNNLNFESSQSSYFYRELEKKNKQITEMQKRINNLIDEKNSLQITIQNLKTENYDLGITNEKENNQMNFEYQNKINQLYQTINYLQNENTLLKNEVNKKDKIEQNYNNTFLKKLNQSRREIDNLSVMNSIKDTILRELQDFVNELNDNIGNKLNCELDFNNDDLNTFKYNLEQIKNKIYSEFSNNTINGNNNFNKENNNLNKEINLNNNNSNKINNIIFQNNTFRNQNYKNDIRSISGMSKRSFPKEKIPSNKDEESLYKRSLSNYTTETLNKELNNHLKDCKCQGCLSKAKKDPSFLTDRFEFKSKAWIKKPDYHSILRTPPRNEYEDND